MNWTRGLVQWLVCSTRSTRPLLPPVSSIHTHHSILLWTYPTRHAIIAVPALLTSVQPVLLSCQENTFELSLIIPQNQFWRWKDLWSNSIRTAVFAAALIEYLSSRTLLTLHQAAEAIGSKIMPTFHRKIFLFHNCLSQSKRSGAIA